MDEMRPADYAVLNGNGGFGGFGGNGIWWILILFVFAMFGWGGNGYGGNGGNSVKDAYVLSSDFATIQRQLSDGFNGIDNALDRQNSGICDLGYTQAQLINNLGMNVMQGNNAIQTQLADCCCKTQSGIERINTNMAANTNLITHAVDKGFCDTQYRDLANTNALLTAGHSDADRIIARLDAMENARKDETIARQNQELFQWQLKSSQADQTAQLLKELGYHCPQAAYVVQPPQPVNFPRNNCGCNCNGTWN